MHASRSRLRIVAALALAVAPIAISACRSSSDCYTYTGDVSDDLDLTPSPDYLDSGPNDGSSDSGPNDAAQDAGPNDAAPADASADVQVASMDAAAPPASCTELCQQRRPGGHLTACTGPAYNSLRRLVLQCTFHVENEQRCSSNGSVLPGVSN